MEFFGAAENLPFSVALCVMLGIALLEGVGTLLGAGFSHFLDALVPEIAPELELDVDLDADAQPGVLTRALGWLRFGEVPALVLLVLFLTAFGLLGLAIQWTADASLGLLPWPLAASGALLLALPVVRTTGGWIGRLLPRDETSAVSSRSFVGRVAIVVLGTARAGTPAQARLRDEHGRSHYVLVEPDLPQDELASGVPVLLVKADGARFRAIRAPSDALHDFHDERNDSDETHQGGKR